MPPMPSIPLFLRREADPEVLHCMARSGGGFASHLALAWMNADASNTALLFDAFGDLYERYERLLADSKEYRDQKGRDTP